MLLCVEKLRIAFGSFAPVQDVTISVDRGEILGLVGESGSGKSLTATALMGLLGYINGHVAGGRILFDGEDLTNLPEEDMRRLRGRRIGLITQNPMTSLDPMIRVGKQIEQAAKMHIGMDGKAAYRKAIDLMKDVRIPDPQRVHALYPHQLSGGMKQRIVIAMALAGEPDLLIASAITMASTCCATDAALPPVGWTTRTPRSVQSFTLTVSKPAPPVETISSFGARSSSTAVAWYLRGTSSRAELT